MGIEAREKLMYTDAQTPLAVNPSEFRAAKSNLPITFFFLILTLTLIDSPSTNDVRDDKTTPLAPLREERIRTSSGADSHYGQEIDRCWI